MSEYKVLIETSAKHVHLSKGDLEKLFGSGAELTVKRELSQPGEFLSNERVSLAGSKGTLSNVAILGPVRAATQVEVSLTDARVLGIAAPIRESGDVKGSAPIKIIGPKGEIDIPEGAIVAKRHVHLTEETATRIGLKNKQIVKVKVDGERALVFDDVVIRVNSNFKDSMHIDYDEANAAGINGEVEGTVIY